jgi:hypothetical protein
MADDKKFLQYKNVITPIGIAAFVKVFEPDSFEGGALKYSLTIRIPKNAAAAKSVAFAELKGKIAAVLKDRFGPTFTPIHKIIRDGDAPDANAAFKGCWYFKCSTDAKVRPPVLDESGKNVLLDDTDFYSGCMARATVTVGSYDTKGGKGAALWLAGVQRAALGERQDGVSTVTEMPEIEAPEVDPMA